MAQISFFKRVARRIMKALDLEARHRFYLVRSPPLPDNFISGPGGHKLYTSAFNPAWFKELGIEPKVIVDIGSYDGGDAYRLQLTAPFSRVLTIEADPYRAQCVRDALSQTEIEVLECAICDEDREVALYRTEIDGIPSSQGSLFQFDEQLKEEFDHISQHKTPTIVTGRSLSSVLKERAMDKVSLLHMDIQGAEYEALQGLKSLRPEIVYLEVNAQYKKARGAGEVHKLMTTMGYNLAGDFITDRLYVHQG